MPEHTPLGKKDISAPPSRRWLRWLRDLALLALVFFAVQWWQSRELVVGSAPPLNGLLLDGTPFQLDPSAGPYLVHFWATWCPICKLQQGSIASIAEDQSVMTVALASGSAEEVAEYLRDEGVGMPVLLDDEGALAATWGVQGVPASFVIATDGNIAYAGKGYSSEFGLRLRLWWAD